MHKLLYLFVLLLVLGTTFTFGAPEAQAQERRGWSPQAKGAVIGAGSGAILGAVINKRNRAVGGVVGGVVGAGAGYAIGKHRDNKNKERARIAEANREAAYRNASARSNRASARPETGPARNRTNALPANGLVATTVAYNGQAPAVPAASNPAYLPNDAYGDPAHPYSTSEYRRKSW